jgi:quercetin dioxygenase-like cupin family protein
MSRGRPPKPTALHILQGTWRGDCHGRCRCSTSRRQRRARPNYPKPNSPNECRTSRSTAGPSWVKMSPPGRAIARGSALPEHNRVGHCYRCKHFAHAGNRRVTGPPEISGSEPRRLRMNTATPRNHFKLTISKANKPVLKPGRRETLTNRDLGTVEATAGQMLALVTSATQGMGPASGWHYHVCEHQLIYVLRGWVDLEAEDGTDTRIEAGDSVIIPGGMRHNVSGTANDIEVLTVTVPAEAETVKCDRPSASSSVC